MDDLCKKYHDALNRGMRMKEMTSDTVNQSILSRLARNDADIYNLWVRSKANRSDANDFCPTCSDDMVWLGFFIGRNIHIRQLVVEHLGNTNTLEDIAPFFSGLSRNKSIGELTVRSLDENTTDFFLQ